MTDLAVPTFDPSAMSDGRTVATREPTAAAFTTNTAAAAAWAWMSFSYQRHHAESIAGAKADETRARRVAKVFTELDG